jgi:hypothetical protein
MDASLIDRIETNVERGASALFALACGYAAFRWLSGAMPQPQLIACGAGVAGLAYACCDRALAGTARGEVQFPVPVFDLRDYDSFESLDELILTDADRLGGELLLTDADRLIDDELLLTDADRLDPSSASQQPLVLDDILAELGPDARVVRLFDRQKMPTAGQLKSRIDDHLEQGRATPADASQALSAALAELRRSLR